MSQAAVRVPVWKRVLFSSVLADKSAAKKIAYIGVAAALCIATNMFEIKFATTQFSFTILSSVLAGILIGPLFGFCAVFLGDGVGYLVNSMGYPYYWWVALSCASMALIAGLTMAIPLRFKGSLSLKLAFICALVLAVCSVGINSTGMYFIGLKLYMPSDVAEAIATQFGGEWSFAAYLIIRFFLLGQIYNNLVNYALIFILVPALRAIKPLKIQLR